MNLDRVFVASDWHLNHRNILKYCPHRLELFSDVDAMTQGIIDRTLRVLGSGDTLYFLGDLTFQIGTKRNEVLELLKPMRDSVDRMHWIRGNHDEPDRMPEVADLFDTVSDAHQMRVGERHVYLSHYPLDVPHRDQLRLVSIHGHHHGSLDNPPGRIDVSIDSLYGLREHFDSSYTCEPIPLATALKLAEMDLPAPFESDGQPRY